jgi:hypothetical protein
MVQLSHVLVVHETATCVPDTYSIIHTQARALSRGKNMLSIGTPFAMSAVGGQDGANFAVVLLKIIDVHMASQISKASYKNETTVG